jgi:YVTN family beta-propeller protein
MRGFIRIAIVVLSLTTLASIWAMAEDANASQFKIVKKLPLEGSGRWDYLLVDGDSRRLYMSRATHFSVLDADSGAVVGDIPDTPGAHGVALATDYGIGFTSNGGENKVSVFDLKTLKVLTKIDTGGNPDSIVYHPATHSVFVQNGKSNSSSVIDVEKKQVVATIPLGAKPEFAVYDDSGNLFVNLENKGAIAVIDTANRKVKATWPIAGCEEPSGLAIDVKNHKLFSACSNKLLAIVDSQSGRLIQTVPIGDDCDAVAFDPETGYVFASNGEGKLTIVHGDASGKYEVTQSLTSVPGSKTMALDTHTHTVYLPTAKFNGDPGAHPRPPVVPGSIVIMVVGKD